MSSLLLILIYVFITADNYVLLLLILNYVSLLLILNNIFITADIHLCLHYC